ncbi:UNVERIFIED_CONTAM: hypothetical protein FKN15_061343 [Acipenser sinensis]
MGEVVATFHQMALWGRDRPRPLLTGFYSDCPGGLLRKCTAPTPSQPFVKVVATFHQMALWGRDRPRPLLTGFYSDCPGGLLRKCTAPTPSQPFVKMGPKRTPWRMFDGTFHQRSASQQVRDTLNLRCLSLRGCNAKALNQACRGLWCSKPKGRACEAAAINPSMR